MSATEQREAHDLTMSDLTERGHARFLWAVTVVTGIGLWLIPAFSGYWLDETVTVWVVRDDLGTTVDRAISYQQSPFYFVIAWLSRQVLGTSEFALRAPSLAAAVLATWLLYRLAVRLHDREVGRLVAFAFVASPWMALAAPDARAYAIAIAAIVGAALALVRWLDGGSAWNGVWFALACALAIWAHYLLGVTVAVLFIYAGVRIAKEELDVSWARLTVAAAAIVALIAPLTSQLLSLADRTSILTIPGTASVEGLFIYLMRPVLVGGVVLGILLARAMAPLTVEPPPSRGRAWGLWLGWSLAAPVVLTALSLLTPASFLIHRYWSAAVPALAGIAGIGIACIGPGKARRVIVAITAIVVIFGIAGTQKYNEGWREAADLVNEVSDPSTPVLIRPGLVESAQLDWLRDPERASYLLAPSAAYDFGGDLILLPYLVDDGSIEYVEDLVRERLSSVNRFLYVDRDTDAPFDAWLRGRLLEAGFEAREIGGFGTVRVLEFSRD